MRKYIAIFDETGTNNRPQSSEDSGFGVGAIIFPREQAQALSATSRKISATLKSEDFKYKDVIKNISARETFISALNDPRLSVQVFAFYSHGACMVHERQRTKEAASLYRRTFEQSPSPGGEDFYIFDSFICYMAGCIAAHAGTNGYAVDVYWDRRTDLDKMKTSFDEHVRKQSATERYEGVAEQVTFCGRAPKDFSPIVRLSGVLAGDVWKYFYHYGHKIWSKLDTSGLIGNLDPYLSVDDPSAEGPVCVATIRERLADQNPGSLAARVMLQGYYKRFLKNEKHEALISFGSPNGQLGIIGICNGTHWKIYQLPD